MTEVLLVGRGAAPPEFSVRQAEQAAADAGCHVSRRGVSVYLCARDLGGGRELARELPGAEGHNGPPWYWRGMDPLGPGTCDASEACQRDCGRRCVHAEIRAFLAASIHGGFDHPDLLRMVHVKIGDDGRVVPSRGPRCVPCATFLLDQGVGGIWLYEQTDLWRYYPMVDFYNATALACQLYAPSLGLRVPVDAQDPRPG